MAFHGSWNRTPEPHAGYDVVFLPMTNGKPSKDFEIFADETKAPPGAADRPTTSRRDQTGRSTSHDDVKGRIWKVVYVGVDLSKRD